MTEKYNALLAGAAESADITVAALEIHGLNAPGSVSVLAKNATTGAYFECAITESPAGRVFFPTTDTIKVVNRAATPQQIQITAK